MKYKKGYKFFDTDSWWVISEDKPRNAKPGEYHIYEGMNNSKTEDPMVFKQQRLRDSIVGDFPVSRMKIISTHDCYIVKPVLSKAEMKAVIIEQYRKNTCPLLSQCPLQKGRLK